MIQQTMSSSVSSIVPELQPSIEQVRAAAKEVASSLGSIDYAIIGGAACIILGSIRTTTDVDFVVLKGQTSAARKLLREQPSSFEIEPKTLHTYYKKSTPPVEIEILAPPALFKETFEKTTPTIVVDGARILKPALILNAKCRSILGRPTEAKRRTDAQDIKYLLRWCARVGSIPTSAEVPNASKDFVTWFTTEYGDEPIWTPAGYDLDKGQFP